MLYGIDISKYQGNVNFDELINSVDFVIAKATEGNGYVDPQFAVNRSESKRINLPHGFYHFARPDLGNTPEAESDWFLNTVGDLDKGDMLFLDYEVNFPDPVGWCKSFLEHITGRTGGYKCLLYINLALENAHDWTPVVSNGNGLWLARWDYDVNAPAPATHWPVTAFRQWSNKATVSGVNGLVDADVFYGDNQALSSYGYSGTAPGQPTPPSPTLNDQTILPIVDEEGRPMELQAVRSELYDKRKELDTAQQDIKDLMAKLPPEPPSLKWAIHYLFS